MGISTVCHWFIANLCSSRYCAPLLLALCRLGQGLRFRWWMVRCCTSCNWKCTEGKRAWYGMFPQLGCTNRLYSGNRLILYPRRIHVWSRVHAMGLAYSIYFKCFTGNCGFIDSLETAWNTCIPKSVEKAERSKCTRSFEVFKKHSGMLVY